MNSQDTNNQLALTAKALLAPGKGILAADESSGTIEKRFIQINVPCNETNRRDYREMLFTAPGLPEFISGVILYDETLRQSTREGVPFAQKLWESGIIPGIKVDRGAKALAAFDEEKITEGLDGLRERFAEYGRLGARFSKWRAVITIGSGLPTQYCIDANAAAMARYAALSQEAGILPIVEPEVIRDGSHSIEECFEATSRALSALFAALHEAHVRLDDLLLKANMVTPGKDAASTSPEEVAKATLRCLCDNVPPAVPGVVFLSGGQSEQEATANLNAMNQGLPAPWELSFSFSRALQSTALLTWEGRFENWDAAQQAILKRSKLASKARLGRYTEHMEAEEAAELLVHA